ncbi:hypothetical protein JG687_00005855 [Phytophthora cactorum]|uniref:Uncharacterized protein n=1 Tax=Phytophthora cactorum TaxID=29920 RepID=A0A8T1UPH3_9STRA|nr:hypothetical protein JG687_00005855 [Phytophthora cactorum]
MPTKPARVALLNTITLSLRKGTFSAMTLPIRKVTSVVKVAVYDVVLPANNEAAVTVAALDMAHELKVDPAAVADSRVVPPAFLERAVPGFEMLSSVKEMAPAAALVVAIVIVTTPVVGDAAIVLVESMPTGLESVDAEST